MKLVNNERHVYLEVAMVQSEANALMNVLYLSQNEALMGLADKMMKHFNTVNPQFVTHIEHDTDNVLQTRDCFCLCCEVNERLSNSDRCEVCTEEYGA